MPLKLNGSASRNSDHEILLEALCGSETVMVVTSGATVADFGLLAIQERAGWKYRSGLKAEDGSVRVFMADML